MGRIRTVKPEFFRHEGLQDLEIQNPGMYVMLVFQGLWTVSDREGRFRWKPRRLKLDILPFLNFDIERVLNLLEAAKMIASYEVGGDKFGQVVNWAKHQLVGRFEPPSEIPGPDGVRDEYILPPNQTERNRIYQRDNYTCVYCGRNMRNDSRAICLDHVHPVNRGGTNQVNNLVVACKSCNAIKGDKLLEEIGFSLRGVRCEGTVNGGLTTMLTGGDWVVDPEREGEREGEREREREKRKESPNGDSSPVPGESVRQEKEPRKRTEGKKQKKDVCPQQQIIETYHACCPGLPSVESWNDGSQKSLAARWFEKKERQDIRWWRQYFERVNQSDFLTGRVKDFMANLNWLIGPKNMEKVLNGAYDSRKAAIPERLRNNLSAAHDFIHGGGIET
jgi:hypothetical protein